MSATDLERQQADHALYQSIHRTHQSLQDIRALLEAQMVELALGGAVNDRVVEDWPVAGLKRRALSNRRAAGHDNFTATAATALLVVEANLGRIGGQIVNSGSGTCILYLADVGRITAISAGAAAIFLAASGGSWDFRLSNALWCGPVSVISAAGTSLTVAQA